MYLEFIILPIIGALIGWITNYFAIKMLFKPYKPVKIPFLPIKIQGILPKRKIQLANSIAETIEKEILPYDYLLSQVNELKIADSILKIVKKIIKEKVEEKVPAFIPASIRESIQEYIINFTEEEFVDNIEQIIDDFQKEMIDKVDLAALVKAKIESFPLAKLEKLIYKISAHELKHIELLGGILGFLVGIGQAIILQVLRFY